MGSVVDAQLEQDCAHLVFYGVLAASENLRDFSVGFSFANPVQDDRFVLGDGNMGGGLGVLHGFGLRQRAHERDVHVRHQQFEQVAVAGGERFGDAGEAEVACHVAVQVVHAVGGNVAQVVLVEDAEPAAVDRAVELAWFK